MTIPPNQEVLYRLPQTIAITGQGRNTIYRKIAEGTFPPPVQLGAQSVAWKKSDLDRWVAARPVADPARSASYKRRGRQTSATTTTTNDASASGRQPRRRSSARVSSTRPDVEHANTNRRRGR